MEAAQNHKSRNLVLWGHNLSDYQEMFDLNDADLDKNILEFGGGPSSFNAQMHALGKSVTSCDDIYHLSEKDLENHIADIFQAMLSKVKQQQDRYLLDNVKSIDNLAALRQSGINTFMQDFRQGVAEKRYVQKNPKGLPFDDHSFDLALSSHYFFSSRVAGNLEAHISLILELIRVAHEVRIFPLLDSHGDISPLVGPLMLHLQQQNLGVEIRQVHYQFQKNGNAMLRIWSHTCELD